MNARCIGGGFRIIVCQHAVRRKWQQLPRARSIAAGGNSRWSNEDHVGVVGLIPWEMGSFQVTASQNVASPAAAKTVGTGFSVSAYCEPSSVVELPLTPTVGGLIVKLAVS